MDKISACIDRLRAALVADLPGGPADERGALWASLDHAGRRYLCASARIDDTAATAAWAALPEAYRRRLFGAMARMADFAEQFRRITKPQPVAVVAPAVFISGKQEQAA